MSRTPIHKDLIALDRAHQATMQQFVLEQVAAWDEGKSEHARQRLLATVQHNMETHLLAFRAEWNKVQARIERDAARQEEAKVTKRP
jgi:hypothetical protein